MPRVLTEEQKAANRQRAKEWRIKAKQKGPEYLEAAKLYSREYRKCHNPAGKDPKKYNERKKRNQRAYRERKAAKEGRQIKHRTTVTRASLRQIGAAAEVAPLSPPRRRASATIPNRLVVTLPFSRHAKARRMARKLENIEKENTALKKQLKRLSKRNYNLTRKLSTPQRNAAALLRSAKVTPNEVRIKTLAPYCETMERVSQAPTKVKKDLFKAGIKRCRRTGCTKVLSSKIRLSRDYVFRNRKHSSMRRSIANAERSLVAEFMKRADNSYELPSKRDQVRGLGKFGLVDTLSNLYQKFKMENPQVHISMAKFCKARPKNIQLIQWTTRRTCLCQKHANVALLCKGSKVLPLSGQDMCKLDDESIRSKLRDLPEKIHFKKWERVEVNTDGKVFKKTKLVEKVLERQAFVTEVLNQMAEFRPHCERVANIYSELYHLKGNLQPMADVMVQLDFAENWTTKYQDEVSACYYNNKQITIHPMVVYYKDNADKIQHQSYVGISSETTHTAPTVMAFINELMPHAKILLPELRVVHFVSDSPSSQYRNRTICAIVAKFFDMFAVKATWTWLEAGHGKGPCDGVGGSVKKKADNIVKSGRLVQGVEDLCAALEGASLKATIMQVQPESIATLKKKLSKWKIPAVNNIMATHCISCAGDGKHLMRREIPCFHSCCHSTGGDFHFGCQGWSHAFSEPFIYRTIDEPTRSTRATDLTTMELLFVPHTPPTHLTNIPTSSTAEIGAAPPSLATDLVSVPVTPALVLDQANLTGTGKLDPLFPTVLTEMVTTPLTSVGNSVPSVPSTSSGVRISQEVPTLSNPTEEPDVRVAVGKQSSDNTKVKIGAFVAIKYVRRWYVAKVLGITGNECEVSYMTPCRGKWKWGHLDIGEAPLSDILLVLTQPHAVGKLFDIDEEDRELANQRFLSV